MQDNPSIVDLTLVEVADAIRKKRVSSVEVTRACLERAERVQPKVNCFIAIEADKALAAARKADRALKARGAKIGSLHGVPLAHKDLYYRAGEIATCGSKILRDFRPDVTSTAVERLARAGAIWLGSLNMAEFAANPTGHNDHWGHCRNPWNTAHIPGGSSSGSGAAVAARVCFGSLGSDTGGSVRNPAAACGVVGLKPTYGLISRYGVMVRSWSQDSVGPMTRTARDCARMTEIVAGADPKDPTCVTCPVPHYEKELAANIKGLRIGVPKNGYYDGASDEVIRAMKESLRAFKSLGARLVEIAVPDPSETAPLSNTITISEAASIHREWMRDRPQDYSPYVRARLEPGFSVLATDYLNALAMRAPFLDAFSKAVFDKVDVLHTPVMVTDLPTLAETQPGTTGGVAKMVAGLTRNARSISYLGLPALAVPAGFSARGLPFGFQLVGRAFNEALLFRAAHHYQQETHWHEAAPKI